MERFNTCDNAGTTISVEVNKQAKTKAFLGYCSRAKKRIDVEPECRICFRWEKKKPRSKRMPATVQRIKQGRKRKEERKTAASKFKTTSFR